MGVKDSPRKSNSNLAKPLIETPWTPRPNFQCLDETTGRLRNDLPKENLKFLNIEPSYCSQISWPISAGIRELIQNCFDAIMQQAGVASEDIYTTVTHNGTVYTYSCLSPSDFIIPLDSHFPSGGSITFYFSLKPDNNKKGLKPSKVWLGWISWMKDENGQGKLELFNRGEPMSLRAMNFGHTSKGSDVKYIGMHGEGNESGWVNICVFPRHSPRLDLWFYS